MIKGLNTYIAGTGASLPDHVITNKYLESIVDTSDEWIIGRTGIRERRQLEKGSTGVDLSENASRMALENACLSADDLDLIIVATVTPDYPTPSSACVLQSRLGAYNAAAFDVSAGCTGFIYAVSIAHQFMSSGIYRNVLVVGVEILTRYTNWKDRSTCVLFGDGAGAVVLRQTEENRGIINFKLKSDGRGANLLMIPGGGNAMPASEESISKNMHTVKMNGNEIFKFVVKAIEEVINEMLKEKHYSTEDIDCLLLHQANLRIIEHVRKSMKLPSEKVPVNIDRFGNTSSATIPITLHEEVSSNRIKDGDLLAMGAFGAGLTWGGIILKW